MYKSYIKKVRRRYDDKVRYDWIIIKDSVTILHGSTITFWAAKRQVKKHIKKFKEIQSMKQPRKVERYNERHYCE